MALITDIKIIGLLVLLVDTTISANPPVPLTVTMDTNQHWRKPANTPVGTVLGNMQVRRLNSPARYSVQSKSQQGLHQRASLDGLEYVRISQNGRVTLLKPVDGLANKTLEFRFCVTPEKREQTCLAVHWEVGPPEEVDEPDVPAPVTPPSNSVNENATHDKLPGEGDISKDDKPTPTSATTQGTDGISASSTEIIVPLVVVPLILLCSALLAFFGRRFLARRKEGKASRMREMSLHAPSSTTPCTAAMSDSSGSTGVIADCRLNPYKMEVTPSERQWRTGERVLEKGWEFPRQRLRVTSRLGEGCFGQVWKCEALMKDGDPSIFVAVKTLKEVSDEKERQDLLQELEMMKMLDAHPNVVTLIGCCTEKDPIFLILEYMSRGTLQTYLRDSRTSNQYSNLHGPSSCLTSRDLTMCAHQVAKGMHYLTGKGLIHRDLAARNVLVSEEHTCKVADFGFARDVIGKDVYERKTDGRLPIRWMAPESLYENIFTAKSDVWSFGVLLWEIVTLGSTPYPGLSAQQVMRQVREGFRLEKPEHCSRELYNLMYYCWSADAEVRPGFSEIVETLESFLLTEMDYIELDRFPERCYYNAADTSAEKV